jgi:6-phosphogluconolactonase (cycloisomerase 2 family)
MSSAALRRAIRRLAIRRLAISLILPSLLVFAGCGNGPKVCNATGCCGAGSDLCPPAQHLYADGLNGQVTVFPVAGNGALGSPTSTTGPAMSLGMAVLNNQFLYVSNTQLTVGGTSTIDAWSIQPGTGALATVSGSPFSLGQFSLAGGLAANNSASVLYVGDAGKIDALKADSMGSLTPLPTSPSPAGTSLYLTVDLGNQFVFASDDAPPGNIFAFTIDSTGALTAVPNSPFPIIPNFVGTTRPSEVVVDTTGSFVYVGLLGTGQVAAFSIVKPGGALNPVPGSPFSAGNGPIGLTTVNNFLYVANAMDGTISGYSINPANGVLSPLANSPFAIRGAAMTTDPGGRLFYVSGAGGIQVFAIDSTTGALTPLASPTPYAGATVLRFVR